MKFSQATVSALALGPLLGGMGVVAEPVRVTAQKSNGAPPFSLAVLSDTTSQKLGCGQDTTVAMVSVDGQVFKSKPIFGLCNLKEVTSELRALHTSGEQKRWNPVLAEGSIRLIGGSLVEGTVTLGTVATVGAVAAAIAGVWYGISSLTTKKESSANSRASEDIAVDIHVPKDSAINDENQDPDSLEYNLLNECVGQIHDNGSAGGCCGILLENSDDTLSYGNLIGVVEYGTSLPCFDDTYPDRREVKSAISYKKDV